MARIAQEVKRAYAACAAALVSGKADLDAVDSLGLNVELPVFSVGQAAELAGVHAQTLRQYDRLGLVVPRRTEGRTVRRESRPSRDARPRLSRRHDVARREPARPRRHPPLLLRPLLTADRSKTARPPAWRHAGGLTLTGDKHEPSSNQLPSAL